MRIVRHLCINSRPRRMLGVFSYGDEKRFVDKLTRVESSPKKLVSRNQSRLLARF